MKLVLLRENFRIAMEAIRSHILRTILTIIIISLGIIALIGTLTSIDALKSSLTNSFTRMGSNTITITDASFKNNGGRGRGSRVEYESITRRQAFEFKERFSFPADVSVFCMISMASTVKNNYSKTNPNISITGGDENYLSTSGQSVTEGRNFSFSEVMDGRNVILIGAEVKDKLFPNSSPLGQNVTIGSVAFTIVGVLESKGSSFGFSGDKSCIVPITSAEKLISRFSPSYQINIMPHDAKLVDAALGEATGLFRIIRNNQIGQKENFSIQKSDNLVSMLLENISLITLAATFIALITLAGASIGLMNILLVSVAERTREIGLRKAIGARNIDIRNQFLIESIIIGQLGGLLGIILGVLVGNLLSLIMNSPFIIPWGWMILGVVMCFITSISAGLLPALRASRLDPIESLRYE